MRLNLEIPWDRYSLIVDIARRFQAQHITLGRTALQKMIFLLQRVFGAECDYNYTLYTYGPYCPDVARDLDIVTGLKGAEVSYDHAYAGYEIHPGPAAEDLLRRGADFLALAAGGLDRLISDYGRANAKELELRSTIIYMADFCRGDEQLLSAVHEVKPHFSLQQIEMARRELEEKNYFSMARNARTHTARN